MLIKIKSNKVCDVCGKKIKKGDSVKVLKDGNIVHEKCEVKNVRIHKK